jgi:DNA recombination-dependent growth factor C
MPRIYGVAETVEEIAARLLPTYHSELATARIKYIYVDKASKKNGKPVLGKARRVSGALEFLTELDFLIEVALDEWNNATDRQKQALVDHLLENCTGVEDQENGGAMKWTMRQPDVNEFTSILHRHGAWTADLQGMVEVAQRLNLEARVQEVANTVQQQDGGA